MYEKFSKWDLKSETFLTLKIKKKKSRNSGAGRNTRNWGAKGV